MENQTFGPALVIISSVTLILIHQQTLFSNRNLLLSGTAITWGQLSVHGYSESALGHTPEPCYATAPNNSHLLLLLLLLCRFNTSQDVPCIYTWIIYLDSPHRFTFTARLCTTDHMVCTITHIGRSLHMAWCTHIFSHVCVTSGLFHHQLPQVEACLDTRRSSKILSISGLFLIGDGSWSTPDSGNQSLILCFSRLEFE